MGAPALSTLHVFIDESRIVFGRPDGPMLGICSLRTCVPLLLERLTTLGGGRGLIDGVAVRTVCAFDQSEVELLGGPVRGGIALFWRTFTGELFARTDLSHSEVSALLGYLSDLRVPAPPPADWRTRRDEAIATITDLLRHRQEAERAGASVEEISGRNHHIAELRRAYAEDLPPTPIARDPLSGEVVSVRMDVAGLDGPYWDAMSPARPFEPLVPTYVVHSGAMRFGNGPIEHTAYVCSPGPEVPYVVPELLGRDGVLATISTVPVGRHVGYAIGYFSAAQQEPPLTNEWGRNAYWLRSNGQPTVLGEAYETWPAPDFDLGPWLAQSKLLWTAPGDTSWTLQAGADDCPYLDLPGRREHQHVQNGKVW